VPQSTPTARTLKQLQAAGFTAAALCWEEPGPLSFLEVLAFRKEPGESERPGALLADLPPEEVGELVEDGRHLAPGQAGPLGQFGEELPLGQPFLALGGWCQASISLRGKACCLKVVAEVDLLIPVRLGSRESREAPTVRAASMSLLAAGQHCHRGRGAACREQGVRRVGPGAPSCPARPPVQRTCAVAVWCFRRASPTSS
jgi:hypothetical protein